MSSLLYVIGLLFITLLLAQIITFEITKRKMLDNPMWALTLDKPFKYNRARYMIFLCACWYMLVGDQERFTMYWLIELLIFVCAGVVVDIVVQYITQVYAQTRSKSAIESAHVLQDELSCVNSNVETFNYTEPELTFKENEVISYYIKENSHAAFMGCDHGEWLKNHLVNTEALFYVEPYGDSYEAQTNLEGTNVTVSKLTQDNKLPFKEEKIDVLVNRYANYNKEEIARVLKPGATAIVIQHGTQNLIEMMRMYMPFGIKGSWDAASCAKSLESIGFKVTDAIDSYGHIYFTDIESLITYIRRLSPELADIKKYQTFYLKALSDIKVNGSFEVTTQSFLVVANK